MEGLPYTPAVSIAEEILKLTKESFSESTTASTKNNLSVDPLAVYNAKLRIQDLCVKLLQTVLGRLEYTALLAGKSINCSRCDQVTPLTPAIRILSRKLRVGLCNLSGRRRHPRRQNLLSGNPQQRPWGRSEVFGSVTEFFSVAQCLTSASWITGTALDCLTKHNYFEEVGGFGTRQYKNNDFSEILKAEHPETLKDAIELMLELLLCPQLILV
jgi:hypothetical protein